MLLDLAGDQTAECSQAMASLTASRSSGVSGVATGCVLPEAVAVVVLVHFVPGGHVAQDWHGQFVDWKLNGVLWRGMTCTAAS